jgi:hypothetical protein
MNFMTSPKLAIGDVVFVPFWVIIEYLDASPPAPFIKCEIVAMYIRTMQSPTGAVSTEVCDLKIKEGLVAFTLPLDYLIQSKDLDSWADKISNWFKEYPKTL